MGAFNWLAVLVGVASLLMSVQCSTSCRGTDGQAGLNGAPGRDGLTGEKGEKGEPARMADGPVDADVLMRLKGEVGGRGLQGAMGPKGYQGNLGAAGRAGSAGLPGPIGKKIGQGYQALQQASSAFSVIRTETSYPGLNQKVTFQTAVVNNPGDFDRATGQFTCRIPGVYYFNFHSVAKVSICLYIASDALTNKLGFCDYNRNNDQVLSGGVVLELTANQKVWLESFRDQQTNTEVRDNREKQIIFNGFLVSASTDYYVEVTDSFFCLLAAARLSASPQSAEDGLRSFAGFLKSSIMLHHRVLLITTLLSLAAPLLAADETCSATGMPGLPGIPGMPGRDGREGQKGQRGEPGAAWQGGLGPQKGEKGGPGLTGYPGKRGQSGEGGTPGIPGKPGTLGEPGEPGSVGVQEKAGFSVARATNNVPDRSSVIKFLNVITNINDDYDTETGKFRCRVPGTYYFVYHASLDDRLGVVLKLDGVEMTVFWDHRRGRRQVTSGSMAVYMSKDQELWLETTDNRGMRGKPAGYSIFSGFLLHQH
ncbi:uncharacterized protein LOC117817461 [Notolabrus celidotus]|uniref:uncharacterized protein LOC117817461 n=1 Tax=Notolabrus celidotus TaxID=1203425 RepID=UPI00148F832E|nr:uncharacterized protein LOC117817461 [Notolabrus celidotus]